MGEPAPDVLDGCDDYIVVPREFIRRVGWPDRWVDLDALVRAATQGFRAVRERKGDVCTLAYTAKADVAYYRRGEQGEAFLYAQCWRGPV